MIKFHPVQPAVHLRDGTVLSVQASSGHWCSPRDDEGPWWAFEIMVVEGRKAPRSWGRPNHGPHGWVSKKKLETLISRRGGIVKGNPWWRNQGGGKDNVAS